MSSLCLCYGISNPSTVDLRACLYLSSAHMYNVTLGNVSGGLYGAVLDLRVGVGGSHRSGTLLEKLKENA